MQWGDNVASAETIVKGTGTADILLIGALVMDMVMVEAPHVLRLRDEMVLWGGSCSCGCGGCCGGGRDRLVGEAESSICCGGCSSVATKAARGTRAAAAAAPAEGEEGLMTNDWWEGCAGSSASSTAIRKERFSSSIPSTPSSFIGFFFCVR